MDRHRLAQPLSIAVAQSLARVTNTYLGFLGLLMIVYNRCSSEWVEAQCPKLTKQSSLALSKYTKLYR